MHMYFTTLLTQALLIGENGWINRRLNYVKECQKNIERNILAFNQNNNNASENQNICDKNAETELENLKKMMIRDCNITEAVEKLNSTRAYRKTLALDKNTDLRQKFPFFLSNPKLVGSLYCKFATLKSPLLFLKVIMDYEEEFRSLGTSGIFVEKWSQYAHLLRAFCNKKFNCEKHTEWADEVENALLLMKALPFSQSRKKVPFKDMVKDVITFKVVRMIIHMKSFVTNTI